MTLRVLNFYRRYNKFIKVSGIVLFTSGVGWVIALVNKTYRNLNNVLDTSIIHYMEPLKPQEQNDDKVEAENYLMINWLKYEDTDENENTKRSWKSLKFAYARRLLSMSDSEDQLVRCRAVKHFAKISNLDNWHYSLLAHLINAKIAVALARTEIVDKRFFYKPTATYFGHNHEKIVNKMKDFLISLNNKANHSCLTYFIDNAFFEQDNERFIDNDSVLTELRKLIKAANDILPLCLESLRHHSAIKNYAEDIVLLNGLPLLMEIHKRFIDSVNVNITICNIIANISVYPDLLEEIYKSGWISILAEWVKQDDIRLSAPAARALANLDRDNDLNALYPNQVYILHPMLRTEQSAVVDVIFVHGLLGGVFYTWRQRDKNEITVGFLGKKGRNQESLAPESNTTFFKSSDPIMQRYIEDFQEHQEMEWEQLGDDFEFVLNDVPINTNEIATGPYTCSGDHACMARKIENDVRYSYCWPKDWLSTDCKNVRIIGVNYDTNLSLWTPMCPDIPIKTTLEERSDEFLEKLVKAGVGKRPIVWVTHSMGGLLVKNMLCKAWESEDGEVKNMCKNTKGIVFYSTPHIGSRLATLNHPTSLVLWPSVEVQELREESPALLNIQEKFINLNKENPIKIISFAETKKTLVTAMKFNFQFVEPRSANLNIGEFFEIPQDHLGICKPANRQSFLYQKVLNLVNEIAKDTCEHCY